MELRIAPQLLVQDLAQRIDRVPDVDITLVQRREAKPQDVGGAVVGNHTVGDEGLHDGVALGMAQAYLTAATLRIFGTGNLQIVVVAFLRHEIQKQLAETYRFSAHVMQVDTEHDVEPGIQR